MKTIILAATVTALAAGGALYAQRPDHPGHSGHRPGNHWPGFLAQHDLDGDGEVSLEEFEAGNPFERLDVNGDGVISQDDFRQRIASRMVTGIAARVIVRADEDQNGETTSADFTAFLAGLDTNGDGELGREELSQPRQGEADNHPRSYRSHRGRGERPERPERPERTVTIADLEASFVALDENADGVVLREELPSRRHGHRGPRGARP